MSDLLETIGVFGAGAMGRGIAQVAAASGRKVLVYEVSAPALAAARTAVEGSLARAVAKGRIDSAAAEAAKAGIGWTGSLEDLAAADLVIEAVPERLDLKRRLFADLEAVVGPETALASNTSSLSLAEIGVILARPERFAGLHFFNPVPAMKLVEVVAAPDSDPGILDRLTAFVESLGKTAVRCADTPGFIVNRCARPFYGEALAILEEAAYSAAEIDAACRQAGYRLGPFAVIDLIGADVHLAATETVSAALDKHPRYHVFEALKRRVAAGELGRKTGKGFVTPAPDTAAPRDATEIVSRIEATLVNEAASLVAEGNVTEPDVNTALRLGLNFPRGPFEIAESIGRGRIVRRLERLEDRAPAALRGRYEPVDQLQQSAHRYWSDLSPRACDPAYDNMAAIPDSAAFPPFWAEKAAAFRDRMEPRAEEIAYGPEPRQRLDLFRPAGPATEIKGLAVFFHGGYWLRLDKSFWSHLAAGPLEAGWAVAIPSYRLAPAVRLTEILEDARAALCCAARCCAADRLETPISLVGHSAGGQLVSRLICRDQPLEQDLMSRVRGCVSISGLHDLRPLLRNAMNAKLRLDGPEARALSPCLQFPRTDVPVRLWVGGDELPAFHAQAEALRCAWVPLDAEVELRSDPNRNHFTVLEGLETARAPLCRAVLGARVEEVKP